jgi:hypothetical protein
MHAMTSGRNEKKKTKKQKNVEKWQTFSLSLRIPSNLMKTSAVPTFNADENLKVTD